MGYYDLDVPEDAEPPEYNYQERRAELLRFAIEAGHPDKISRTKMAERYDVDKSTITRDMQRIAEEIHDHLNSDAELVTSVIYRKVIRELMDNKEYEQAVETLESWNEWLFQMGYQDKAADKLEVDADPGELYMEALRKTAEEDG